MRYQSNEANANCTTYENDCILFSLLLLYFVLLSSLCWQNEWVGNLLITYVSCFLRVFSDFILVAVFFLYIFLSVPNAFAIWRLHRPQCWCYPCDCIWIKAFIADLLVESFHHHHLSRVRLLSCSPSSISYGDFGTKFWFAVRLGTMRERFRCVAFVSGND